MCQCHDCSFLLILIPLSPPSYSFFLSALFFCFFSLSLLSLRQSFEFGLFCFFFPYSLFILHIRVYGFNWNILLVLYLSLASLVQHISILNQWWGQTRSFLIGVLSLACAFHDRGGWVPLYEWITSRRSYTCFIAIDRSKCISDSSGFTTSFCGQFFLFVSFHLSILRMF